MPVVMINEVSKNRSDHSRVEARLSQIMRFRPDRIAKQDWMVRFLERIAALRMSLVILRRPRRLLARTRAQYLWLQERENRVLVIVALSGIVFSTTGFFVTKHIYDGMASEEFRHQAALYTQVVQKSLHDYSTIVHDAAEPFDGAPSRMDRWDFFEYSKSRLPRYPGIKSLIWAPRVPAERRQTYEQGASNDGLFGFVFRQQEEDGSLVSVTPRPEYFPAYYMEPFQGNEQLAGLDLGVDPTMRAAMDMAAASGQAAVATPEAWPDAEDTERPFIIFEPVYLSKGVPEIPERRAELLAGFVVAVVDVATAFRSTIDEFTTPGWLDAFLCEEDGVGGGTRLLATYASPLRSSGQTPVMPDAHDDATATRTSIEFAGRDLLMVVAAVPGYFRSGAGLIPWATALIGLLLTVQLVQYLTAQRRREDAMRRTVSDRTEQLHEAHELNEALRLEVQYRTEVERQLRAAKTHAEIGNRSKSEFLALISHELRTPLNAIIGFSEILSYEMFGPLGGSRYKGYAGDINDSARHLLGVINSILDLTRVEGNQYQLNESDVDLVEVIHGSARMLECKAKVEEIDIIVTCNKGLPFVFADEMALRQVFTNLLQNAVKFTPAGGRIVVNAGQDRGGRIVVEVTDNGIGIAADDIDRVLEPFVQADASLSRRYEGVGLGLPLCRKFADMHDGALELESEFGVGTTVRLVLPESRAINVLRAAM